MQSRECNQFDFASSWNSLERTVCWSLRRASEEQSAQGKPGKQGEQGKQEEKKRENKENPHSSLVFENGQ